MRRMSDTFHEISIFYAWQTDSPPDTNRNAIRNALTSASAEIESQRPGLVLKIDEATRDMLGADNVPDSIRAKVEAADIFVGDVTTITRPPTSPGDKARPCPNPNVTFEVGYAAAHLGWKRMIILMNTHIAKFDDLPFDFDRQRVSQYLVKSASDRSGINQLKKLLITAITAIVDGNPPRPAELKNANPAEIRRRRDIDSAVWALRQINIPLLQSHIDDLPYKIDTDLLDFFYDYCGVIGSDLFHVNDPDLDSGFRGLYAAWQRALAPGHNYHAAHGRYAFFGNPGDMPLSPEQQTDWDEIVEARNEMRLQIARLLDVIRRNYVEIDLKETSRIALENWQKEKADRQKRLADFS
jgi:hypothetical protein